MSVSSIGSAASSIDFSELRKKMADRMAEKMLKDLDSDGDGAISKSELAKASQAAASSSSSTTSAKDSKNTSSLDDLFKAMDADGDGSVSKSELAAFMEKAGPPQGSPLGAPPAGSPPPGPPPDLGSAHATASSNATSSTSSTSGSSSTSSASSSSASTDPMDANGDGTVTAEERMAFAYQQLMAALQRLGDAASESGNTSTISVTS